MQVKGLYGDGFGGSTKKKNTTTTTKKSTTTTKKNTSTTKKNTSTTKKNTSSSSSNKTTTTPAPSTPTVVSTPQASYTPSFSYAPYQESQAVINARNAMNAHNANKIADWTGGTYGAALSEAMDRILNREDFSYDFNADALYQQYKDQYINQGNLAMQDTIGQASGMTGGYGTSYASTAGNQAYQGYLTQLNNVIPQLYNLAVDKYNMEGQKLYDQYDVVNGAYNTEYGQYRDKVSDWYAEADRLASAYYNAANMDYSRYSDAYDRAFKENQYAQSIAQKQAQIAAKSQQDADKKRTSAGYTSGDVVQFLASTLKDSRGNTLTKQEKIKYLQDAGVSSAEISAANKYVVKDKQVKDRL